jgi:hypothetical protein
MATLNVLFTFNADADSFAFSNGGPNVAGGYQAGDGDPASGCLEVNQTTKNRSSTGNHWSRSLTFESMGVPAGATITGISSASIRTRCSTYTSGLADANRSDGAYLRIVNQADIEVAPATAHYTGVTAWAQQSGAGAAGLSLPSDTSVEVSWDVSIATANTGGATVVIRGDTIAFTVEYDEGANQRTGALAGELTAIEGSFSGERVANRDGTLAGQLGSITGSFAGERTAVERLGTLAGTLSAINGTLTGARLPVVRAGVLSGTLAEVTGQFTGDRVAATEPARYGQLAGQLAEITGSFVGAYEEAAAPERDGTLSGELAAITGSFVGGREPAAAPQRSGTVSGQLAAMSGALEGVRIVQRDGWLAGALSPLEGGFIGVHQGSRSGVLNGTLNAIEGSFSGLPPGDKFGVLGGTLSPMGGSLRGKRIGPWVHVTRFARRNYGQLWIRLQSNEQLGVLDSGYIQDYYGDDGFITLVHLDTGVEYQMAMLPVPEITPEIDNDVFEGTLPLAGMDLGMYEVRFRVVDLLGNYSISNSVQNPFGTERMISLMLDIVEFLYGYVYDVGPLIARGGYELDLSRRHDDVNLGRTDSSIVITRPHVYVEIT